MADEVIYPLYLKWRFFFDLFDKIIEHKSGDYRYPPFQTVDWPHQPFKTMQILDYMRELWVERLEVESEKQVKNRR